jgi:phosphoglycerate dehydrogenase-like enzyme
MSTTVVSIADERVIAAVESVDGATSIAVADLAAVDALVEQGQRADAMYVSASGDPLLERAGDLGVRWIHIGGTGVDSLSPSVADGRVVTCSRGASGVPIAEFVLMSMLAFEKRAPECWIEGPPTHWGRARFGEMSGKTLALVGVGGIGLEVARRALAFDMEVVALRRRPEPTPLSEVEVVTSLDGLLARADHLVLAAPSTAATRHLLDAAAFARVKPGVHVVNIARGALIDQEALRAALDDGRVAFASLDTTSPEPLPEGHWLYAHPRVHVSAHVSYSSPNARQRIVAGFAQNLARFVADEELEGIVDVSEGY